MMSDPFVLTDLRLPAGDTRGEPESGDRP